MKTAAHHSGPEEQVLNTKTSVYLVGFFFYLAGQNDLTAIYTMSSKETCISVLSVCRNLEEYERDSRPKEPPGWLWSRFIPAD